FWNEAWANFSGGWQETARRDDGRRFAVDFDLSLNGAIYSGRQISRAENNWLIVLRLVGLKDNARLIYDLDTALWPGIAVYPDAAKTAPEWVSVLDQTAGYMVRVTEDWKVGDIVLGKPLIIRGASNRVPVTIRAKAEPGKAARAEQAAQLWVKALHKDA